MSALTAKVLRSDGYPDRTRLKLLAAAAEVFAERGFHAATVREICQRAKVNVALVNYHFGGKLELYTEVLQRAMDDPERIRALHELAIQPEPPEVVLRKMIAQVFSLMLRPRQRDPLQMRLMLHELARPTAAIAKVVDDSVKPVYQRLCHIAGQILELPADHQTTRLCVQSIIAQAIHYANHSPVISRLWPDLVMTPEQQDAIANHIADFSLAYIKSDARRSTKALHHPPPDLRAD